MNKSVHTLYIIIATLILTACQGESKYYNKLQTLDSELAQSPDSVYKVLMADEEEAQQQSHSTRMYYELLLADARNKASVAFATDTTMLKVAEYFNHSGSSNEQLRAHYLLSCTYRDLGDEAKELQCLQKAVEKTDSSHKDCDMYTLYAVYSQMASLYHAQNMQQEELKALEKCGAIVQKTSMYNYGNLKKIAKQKEEEVEKTRRVFWISMGLSLLVIITVIAIAVRTKRTKERKIAEITKYYVDALAEKESMEGDIAKLQLKVTNMESNVAEERRKMEEAMAQKKEALAEVQRQIDFYTARIDVRDILQLLFAFKGTEICSKFKNIATSKDHTIKVTSGDWDTFMRKYHHYFPAFHSFIVAGSQLTLDEQRICLLTAVEFSATEVSKLLNLQKSQVSNLRASANRKLFSEEGSKTLNANLNKKFFAY